jgi:hypothetical protein
MSLRLLAVSEPSGGGEAVGMPLTRQDECMRIVFRAENLVRLIVSVLLGASIFNGKRRGPQFEAEAKQTAVLGVASQQRVS